MVEQYQISRKQNLAITLYRSEVCVRQYEKAFRELGCEHVIFTSSNGKKRDVDSDDLKIAKGIARGAYMEMAFDITFDEKTKQSTKTIDQHSKDIADGIIKLVKDYPSEDLYLK